MRRLAVIPARGGSKRIPRKNINLFLGRPIIEYSIEAALQSGIFDEVMVSTDDEEIARIAEKAGAKVPFFRSKEAADDMATTAQVLEEVITSYAETGEHFDALCCIYPTAPFVTAQAIQTAMEMLEKEQADACIPIVKFSFPPQRCVVVQEGRLTPKWPENMNMRSQDLEPFYHDCGQFYVYDVKKYRACRGDLPDGYFPIEVPELEVQDIDNMSDWKLAEIKYQMMNKTE